MKLGLPISKAIVDPAILASDYSRRQRPSGHESLTYMPHCASARSANWAELCDDLGLRYIDPHWPVEKVLDELQQASGLLTEALHGAILADAFRIPWTPVKSSPAVLDFKWHDWCQSVGLSYEPVTIQPLWRSSGSVVGRARFSIKKLLARRELKRLRRSRRAWLSTESTFAAVKLRLIEAVDRFRNKSGGD